MVSRRHLLIGAGAAGALAALASAGCALRSGERRRALVYRGSAACSGCAEAVAALLAGSPTGFRTEFCGPGEERALSRAALAEAAVYAQPGGGSVRSAWRRLREYADDIREFVHNGGTYLGFCLGAYLAADNPGFGLLPGKVDQYIGTPGASVRDTDDTLVPVRWRGERRTMY